jgi:hypothetical protein
LGRRFTGWLFVSVFALGVAVTPAGAKDRKSAARDSGALAERLTMREARAMTMRQEPAGARDSASVDGKPNGRPIAPLADGQEIKASNPFRFNIGAVAVQPAVGGIKGAQFSIGF